MKKLVFIVPLMAISLLASCGGGDKPGPTPGATYTLTFNCTDCKALDENKNEITSVQIATSQPYTTYNKFYLDEKGVYKKPLKSLIKIEKTNKNEEVDFEYNPLTGEILIPVIDNLTITASGIKKTLEECTWDQINEISTTGRAREFFDVYNPDKPNLNCKKVTLIENGESQTYAHTVRIIGFNHDDLADGSGKAGITFEFANVITINNKSDTYNSHWDGIYQREGYNYDYCNSVINTFLNDETDDAKSIFNILPKDLSKKGIIKPVNKLVGVNESKSAGKENYMTKPFDEDACPKLFLLAHDEMQDPEAEPTIVSPGEAGDPATGGGIYEYYKGHSSGGPKDWDWRKKNMVDGSRGVTYWLRSPNIGDNLYAWVVNYDGLLNEQFGHAMGDEAVAPAFCI